MTVNYSVSVGSAVRINHLTFLKDQKRARILIDISQVKSSLLSILPHVRHIHTEN